MQVGGDKWGFVAGALGEEDEGAIDVTHGWCLDDKLPGRAPRHHILRADVMCPLWFAYFQTSVLVS